ncbi:type 1 fimbrial protein [Salmonella enterica]|nr:type 1 fimbrial protein [Salmonella enterica]ECD4514768.1 type 1 fimbrial protein [Salmonella enterica subsp. enterica serovar Sandiego]ECF1356166.1 type 1 fimbrial protein [Salmonella enterica subsp. enterica serovar Sandiego]ECV4068483.1 type 1 fimbrial protein [Salmonella enterica]ECZ0995780.1 type 1 fimbrial protein [Salmonella enterica]
MKSTVAVAVFAALGFASSNAMAADVNSGQVTFDGTVVDTPCNLMPGQDGEDVKVPFGQLSMSQLNADKPVVKPFTINLEGCVLNGKTAGITFNALNTNAGNTLINTAGTATGLGIGIDGITFGTEKVLTGMHDGKVPLNFEAMAKKAVTGTDVTAGTFNAVSNFIINYR